MDIIRAWKDGGNDQVNDQAKRRLRTEISDISAFGPELNEEELRLVTGGRRPTPASQTCAESYC